jgi:pimeloyl-ACP methyl ester carboxylesterase
MLSQTSMMSSAYEAWVHIGYTRELKIARNRSSQSTTKWAYGPDAPAAGRPTPPPPTIPVGFTTFPGEICQTPRSWAEASYPTLSYFHEADRGGHFAAWEEPELFATELRAAFRPLR